MHIPSEILILTYNPVQYTVGGRKSKLNPLQPRQFIKQPAQKICFSQKPDQTLTELQIRVVLIFSSWKSPSLNP